MDRSPTPLLALLALRADALDALADAACITDADGVVLHVNAACQRVTGFPPAEVLGAPYSLLLPPSYMIDARADIEATLAKEGAWQGELEMCRREGGTFVSRCMISRMPGGHLVHVFRDISAYRRVAEAARRSIISFRTLIEESPDGIAVHRNGNFVYANLAFATFLKFPGSHDLVGTRLLDRVHPDDRAGSEKLLESGGDAPAEVRLTQQGGGTLYAKVRARPVVFDGLPATVLIAHDLTQRRAMEVRMREMDRMVSIGTLAAGIAHEINTPIQFVGDSAHFLKGALTDLFGLLGRYRALAEAAKEAGWRADLIAAIDEEEEAIDLPYLEEGCPKAVGRTLDGVSRVAAIVRAMKEFGHPGTTEMACADLNNAILNTLTVARNEWKYVAEVSTDLGDLPPVRCHLGSMNQVFLNLVVNAAHAIGDAIRGTERQGSIRIATSQRSGVVRITISDDGSGIPEWARARIFDPFFTTKEVGKGTGQGLAIARSIVVEKHGGSLTFETAIGEGTTFCIELPVGGPPA